MLKTMKQTLRGAVYGYLLGIATVGVLIYPHTQFRISASNVPIEQQLVQDTSESLAALLPPVKPKVK